MLCTELVLQEVGGWSKRHLVQAAVNLAASAAGGKREIAKDSARRGERTGLLAGLLYKKVGFEEEQHRRIVEGECGVERDRDC